LKTKISDIARKANVSSMTVSRVLNNSGPVAPDTKKLINKIIKEENYQPNLIARSLSQNKTMILGIVVPRTDKIFLDDYIAQVLSGITSVALKNDYKILLLPYNKFNNEKKDFLSIAKSKLVDGMILLKAKSNDSNLDILAESGFPFVLVNLKKRSKNYNFVDSENIEGVKNAINYLYSKGHRKIAFVAGAMDETNAQDRMTGYKNTLKKLNIPLNKNYIIYGEFDEKIAYKETDKLLNLKTPPTAIFCSDDYMAIGVMNKIKERGLKVPKDIAIIGFDNIEIGAYLRPSLTTIKQPMYEIGKSSVEILLKLMSKNSKPPIRKMLSTELIIRESV